MEKMMEYLYQLPAQFDYSLKMNFDIVESYKQVFENVVISGLGGSAIGGDILRTFALSKASLPVVVNRDYDCPAFVSPKTLVLVVSYSGNTEETISSYKQARAQGAAIICISSGGKLESMAREDGCALLKIPGGMVPRAATGLLFAPAALILENLGIISGVKADIEESIKVLENMRQSLIPDNGIADNPAKQIAAKMKGTIPVIWGTAGFSEVAALRWKAQINENAKSPAYYNTFPELNHNEIVGFEAPEDLLSRITVIILQDNFDNPQVKKRIAISREIIKERVKNIIEVKSQGKSWL
ncbi:MAG: bifunctional phosphoglucose/phosphomannose isomerase, partial [Syntrophomonadaceae bacterium]|nr:bifunctional phosphoglucose/phosphomannose isomerase [Syntrophomonadaceae bacterium]